MTKHRKSKLGSKKSKFFAIFLILGVAVFGAIYFQISRAEDQDSYVTIQVIGYSGTINLTSEIYSFGDCNSQAGQTFYVTGVRTCGAYKFGPPNGVRLVLAGGNPSGFQGWTYVSGPASCTVTYCYFNFDGGSAVVKAVFSTPPPPPPQQYSPEKPIVSVKSKTTSSVEVQWNFTQNTNNYKVYRGGVLIATLPLSTLNYNHTGLACGTSYVFRIGAWYGAGTETLSDNLTASTNACPSPTPNPNPAPVSAPPPPAAKKKSTIVPAPQPTPTVNLTTPASNFTISSVQVNDVGRTEVSLAWHSDTPATATVLYGLTSAYGETAATTEASADPTVKLTGLSPATSYHFKIQAVSTDGKTAETIDAIFSTKAYQVRFTILDSNNNPLPGAELKIGENNFTADQDGQVLVEDVQPGLLDLAVAAYGTSESHEATISEVPADEADVAQEITILTSLSKPWWQTTWAKLILLLLIAIGVAIPLIIAYLKKRRQLEATRDYNEQLQQNVDVLSHAPTDEYEQARSDSLRNETQFSQLPPVQTSEPPQYPADYPSIETPQYPPAPGYTEASSQYPSSLPIEPQVPDQTAISPTDQMPQATELPSELTASDQVLPTQTSEQVPSDELLVPHDETSGSKSPFPPDKPLP